MAPTATPPTRTPLLELRDQEPDRPTLKLAGETYHFSLRSDLSLEEIARANRIGERMQGVSGADPEEMTRVAAELREVVRIAMHDLPEQVVATLTDGECLAIIEAFTRALPQDEDEATPAAPASSQTTSPDSAASTPVPPRET